MQLRIKNFDNASYRLRLRTCVRCNKYFKGTKYSKICPKCIKPNYYKK